MKKKIILILLSFFISVNTYLTYSMQKDEDVQVAEVKPVKINILYNTVDILVQEVKNIVYSMQNSSAKDYLVNLLENPAIKKLELIKILVDFSNGREKCTFSNAIKKLIDTVDLDYLSNRIAQELECDQKVALEILERLLGKKQSYLRSLINKLSPRTINMLRKMTVGSTAVIVPWLLLHGLSHDVMEFIEPQSMEVALPLAIATMVGTGIVYNSDKALSFFRTQLIDQLANIAVKYNLVDNVVGIDLDSNIQDVVAQTGDTLVGLFTKNEDLNSDEQIDAPIQDKGKELAQDDDRDYQNFLETLTDEQKTLLLEDCNNNSNYVKFLIEHMGEKDPGMFFNIESFPRFYDSLSQEQREMIYRLIAQKEK